MRPILLSPFVFIGCLWLLTACSALSPNRPPNVLIAQSGHDVGKVLAVNPASSQLASGGSEGGIHLWRLADGVSLGAWRAHAGSIYGLSYSASGTQLLSAGYDGVLARWDLQGRNLQRVTGLVPITAFADNGHALVTGHRDGSLRWWDRDRLQPLAELSAHRGKVVALALTADSSQVASSGADGQVALSRPQGDLRRLPKPPTLARTLTFAPDGTALYGGGWFQLYRWDSANNELQALDTEHRGIIQHIQFLPDQQQLASISRQTDSSVLILDPETGASRQFIGRHELCGDFVTASPDGRYLATTADDASIRIWERDRLLERR